MARNYRALTEVHRRFADNPDLILQALTQKQQGRIQGGAQRNEEMAALMQGRREANQQYLALATQLGLVNKQESMDRLEREQQRRYEREMMEEKFDFERERQKIDHQYRLEILEIQQGAKRRGRGGPRKPEPVAPGPDGQAEVQNVITAAMIEHKGNPIAARDALKNTNHPLAQAAARKMGAGAGTPVSPAAPAPAPMGTPAPAPPTGGEAPPWQGGRSKVPPRAPYPNQTPSGHPILPGSELMVDPGKKREEAFMGADW